MKINLKKIDTCFIKVFILLIIMLIIILISGFKMVHSNENYEQQISTLNNEIFHLKEENKSLIDELRSVDTDYAEELERIQNMIDSNVLITSSEFELLARVVYCEANIEPFEGQVAVARVVLNRWIGSKWKDSTIEEVIYHEGQFTQILGKLWEVNPTIENYKAVLDALKNTINMPIEVDSFETIQSNTQNNKNYTRWKTIGSHNFNILSM